MWGFLIQQILLSNHFNERWDVLFSLTLHVMQNADTTKSPRKCFGTGAEFGILYQNIKFRIKISKIGTMPDSHNFQHLFMAHGSEKLKSLVFARGPDAPWQSTLCTQTLKKLKKTTTTYRPKIKSCWKGNQAFFSFRPKYDNNATHL